MNIADAAPHSNERCWTLVIPCAAPLLPGSPSRPKWLLTTPGGDLLVARAAASVPPEHVGRVIVAFLHEAEERYRCSEAIRRAFDRDVECIILSERTEGPAHTVREVISRAEVEGPICIKDGDSFFSVGELPTSSFLAVGDVRNMSFLSAPGRKSYVRVNEQGLISEIVEKNVGSNLISVGLYGFVDAAHYVTEFERLQKVTHGRRLFVSHVAASALSQRHVFLPCFTNDLVDIGTLADWNRYRASFPTVVADLDGVVFRNQSKFFEPFWGAPTVPIEENVKHLLALQQRGAQLVFMTARPEVYRSATLAELESLGLNVHALVMGCNHGTRFLVNDYAQSNAYPSAVAINIRRNVGDLQHLLLPDLLNQDQDI